MDDNIYWQGINTLGQSVQAGAGMIVAADLSAKNRGFYEEQYTRQRQFNQQEREAAQRYNTAEREAVQDWNEYMWERQNEYNSPSAQMARMMKAGINPNNAAMAIGAQSGAPVNAVSPATSPSASVSPPGMPQQFNPAQAYAEMYNSYTMAQEQRSQARLNDVVAKKTEEETQGLIIDNNYKPFEKEADLQQVNQKIKLMVSQGLLTDSQANEINTMLPLYEGKTVSEIQQINEGILNQRAERDRIVEQINLLQEQIVSEKHHQKQMDAASYEAYMSGLEHKSAIDLNGKKMSLSEAEESLKRLEHQRNTYDFNLAKHYREKYGYDINEHGVDRLLSNLGFVIERQGTAFQDLWDSTKTRLNSIGSSVKSSLLPKKNGYKPVDPNPPIY